MVDHSFWNITLADEVFNIDKIFMLEHVILSQILYALAQGFKNGDIA